MILGLLLGVRARRITNQRLNNLVTANDTAPRRDCLCLFDVDRTLTAKQWSWKAGGTKACPGTKAFKGGSFTPCKNCKGGFILDEAYSGGPLTMGPVGINLKDTFCGKKCYMGIVSAGWVSGANSEAREKVMKAIPSEQRLGGGWADDCGKNGVGPLMLSCHEGIEKYKAAVKVQEWFASRGAKVADDRVFFFDDKSDNVGAMDTSKHAQDGVTKQFNAFQVSCGGHERDWSTRPGSRKNGGRKKSWEGALGRCGATMPEIAAAEKKRGVHLCPN